MSDFADMKPIFVFGSNLAGRHGAGSALAALKLHGAEYGVGVGRQGNSYAIPTKGFRMEVLPLPDIARYVNDFLVYAADRPELDFHVIKIGCGLAGYREDQIAPMFYSARPNISLPNGWRKA
jgi:hypothetical protein